MNDYINIVSGWLSASGQSLLDILPAGSPCCRVVRVDPQDYWIGFVSIAPGSFKPEGASGNWYGTTFDIALAETLPSDCQIYEYSRLAQDTPVWNMHKLPKEFRDEIYQDRDLPSGQFLKSQFVTECLNTTSTSGIASGIVFPSRRHQGGSVVVLNPALVTLNVVYTGQAPPPPSSYDF